MQLRIFPEPASLARAAAQQAEAALRAAIENAGFARLLAASAASQIDFLAELTACRGIDWARVQLFQLDEYIGIPSTHRASFSRFLQDNLIGKTGIVTYSALDGMADPLAVIRDAGRQLKAAPIDVAFVGIGENGHLAFNDPPADFLADEPYLIVKLDHACRRQQVNEGWFPGLSEVPERAISVSIQQILKAREIVAVVPDLRKARAVHACLDGDIGPMHPASALRNHPNATVYLDEQSASLLKRR